MLFEKMAFLAKAFNPLIPVGINRNMLKIIESQYGDFDGLKLV